MQGYIYFLNYAKISNNPTVKIGSTKFPHSRLRTYQTGMFYDLHYYYLYQIINSTLDCYQIDDLIQETFNQDKWKVKTGQGGTEWYDSTKITNKVIEDFFQKNNIIFKYINLEDCPKDENIQDYTNELIQKQIKQNYCPFQLYLKPYDYQQIVLNNLDNFKKTKRGKLLWACGLGKTYMSLFICHKLKFKNILICVPSLYLLKQFYDSVKKIFNFNPLCLYGTNKNLDQTINKIKCHDKNIIISTYHSSWKLLQYNINFDIKIGDEAHHLVSKINPNNKKTFDKFHQISSNYTLFMTATEKKFESSLNFVEDEVYTMSDEEDFGCIIDKKPIKWAIENKKITDLRIFCLQNSSSDIKEIMKKIKLNIIIKKLNNIKNTTNKEELFFSAYTALKMIEDNYSNHMLIYTNNCYSAKIIEIIIDKLLDNNIFPKLDKSDFYNKTLTSKTEFTSEENINDTIISKNSIQFQNEVVKFTNKKYGIIPCVYIFGEGFDLPKLDSVVIAEKMTTEIRIVQSCLRPNRLDKNNPNKISKIIIPLNKNQIDDKLKMVIKKLSVEDDTIEQKIKLFELVDVKKDKKESNYNHQVKFKKNLDKLNQLKIEMYRGGYLAGFNLQKEYELYHERVLSYNFKSIKDYQNSKMEIIKPNIYFNGVWTNWFDFLGINTTGWIDNIIEWKLYCQEKRVIDANDYYIKIDDKMPPEPEYFYPNFKGINKELGKNKYRFVRN
ncbi:putative superfamily II helicase/restriction enzyme [Cafeteria roenbergensis virus]|uniref:Putative superfamily II helicase/restriction enzyme n=1 Tax=Cafeteria roenbergensis virus (strain BV-PW1) TaxID=693272 RepID=E3T5U7_CROVB|nr:putative superfamily II helicase/restriction enzyme [Cafeteria roenbergensis virus BV-PW1]ADO67560.1 putative superfamily II helicase/restriction enzyme [Cafeteria roenbergensis virus BV-PW1]